MLRKFKNIRKKSAFTLIELIVVIAILGILVLLGGPKLLGYTEKAELTRIQHDTKVMENKMAEMLNNSENDYSDWQNNEKDLGTLVLRGKLFEKEGLASRVDNSHLIQGGSKKQAKLNDNNTLGVGGAEIAVDGEESTGYKIIPDDFKKVINTKLGGTFYSNALGKVYYEADKPLGSIKGEQVLACFSPESLDYEFDSSTGTIKKYNGTLTRISIPAAFLIDGKCVTVKVIGKGAFSRGELWGDKVKEIIIPESVEKIEEDAFKDNELVKIEIPSSVESVGDNAFAGNGLTDSSVVVKNNSSDVTIGSGSFGSGTVVYKPTTAEDLEITYKKDDTNKTVSITGSYGGSSAGGSWGSGSTGSGSGSTGSVGSGSGGSTGSGNNGGSNSFSNSDKVLNIPEKIIIENEEYTIIEVGKGAYQGQGIIHVKFPSTLETIEDYAFAGNQLINVEIPKSVGHIGNYAFAFNEINKELTMEYVKILDTNYKQDINNKTGNIEKNSLPIDKLDGQVKLLSHIFVLSGSGHNIPEDYKPTHSETSLYDFTEMTFSSAGASGYKGPTQAQVDKAYQGTELAGLIQVFLNGVQLWTVPKTGTYEIETRGGEGGYYQTDSSQGYNRNGGTGAIMKGEFQLKKGALIKILVGQRGVMVRNSSGGGGNGTGAGGSFVWEVSNDNLLIAAGGGGGAGYTQSGDRGNVGTNGSGRYSGSHGQGGRDASGGSGWLSSGGNYSNLGILAGGVNGFGQGGFGGGANITGGGGGYSGGGRYGGGGSFNSGNNQVNSTGNSGNGSVKIKALD